MPTIDLLGGKVLPGRGHTHTQFPQIVADHCHGCRRMRRRFGLDDLEGAQAGVLIASAARG